VAVHTNSGGVTTFRRVRRDEVIFLIALVIKYWWVVLIAA